MKMGGAYVTFPSLFERGRLAQLVEHLVYTERVIGSSPIASTSEILDHQGLRTVLRVTVF